MYITMKDCILACACLPFKGVIHVGAHAGEEGPDYQANGVRDVIWVEGNPELMEGLEDRTEPLTMQQYYVGACLSDKEEELEFNIASNGHSSSILELGTHATMYPHIKYTKAIKVKTHRFDKLAEKIPVDLADYDFLNLDVQGAELKVLKGFGDLLNNPSLKAVYTEINFEHVYKDCCLVGELDEYLLKFGFQRIITAAPERTWGDALYFKL